MIYVDDNVGNMEYYLKLHFSPEGNVVAAICDKEILGNVYREGKLKLDVSNEFFGGKLSTLEECLRTIRETQSSNLCGEKIIGAAIAADYLAKDHIIYIDNIPHAIYLNTP